MNRKTVLPFLFAAILFASLGSWTHPVRADPATFISFPSGITLYSPINRTYNSPSLTLNLNLYCAGSMGYIDSRISMKYSIDGKYNGPVPLVVSNPGVHVITNGAGLLDLPELPEGSHILTLYLEGFNQKYHEPRFLSYVDTVYFAIDLTPPNISILSPLNKTNTVANITTAKIPLDFTVSENFSQVAFSLDGQDDILIAGNTTLKGLSAGSHNVTMYARDAAGNTGATETIYFVIAEEPRQEPEPETEQETFPTLLAAGVIGIPAIVAASIGFIRYNSKKRKLIHRKPS